MISCDSVIFNMLLNTRLTIFFSPFSGKGRPIPSGTVAASSLHLRSVRLRYIPDHSVHPIGLDTTPPGGLRRFITRSLLDYFYLGYTTRRFD